MLPTVTNSERYGEYICLCTGSALRVYMRPTVLRNISSMTTSPLILPDESTVGAIVETDRGGVCA